MRTLVALAVSGLLAAACASGGAPQGAATTIAPLSALGGGDPLPAAELPDLVGDGSFHTEELAGEPALINFWATWCAFCVEEMPDLERVHDEVGDRVTFVGVDREDDLDDARTLAEETGVSYRLVVDDDGSFFRALEARGMPTTVFVDADGTIVHRHAGPLTAEDLRDLIAEHLGVAA